MTETNEYDSEDSRFQIHLTTIRRLEHTVVVARIISEALKHPGTFAISTYPYLGPYYCLAIPPILFQ